jgi:ribosomal protein L11 methyltransferase
MKLEKTYAARLSAGPATAQRLLHAVGESLEEQGAVAAAFAQPDGRWTFSVHFRQPPNETAVRALVALCAGAALANALSFEQIEAKDWVAASLQGLAPVAARRFVVYGRHYRGRFPVNRIGIEIEAALAFGTGHHGTTRGCLLALDEIMKHLSPGGRGRRRRRRVRGNNPLARRESPHPNPLPNREREKSVLDIGTGTGVLAIAAARARHQRVLASDIDRRAVAIARQNARINGVAPLIEVIHAGGLQDRRFRTGARFDIVFANILLGPLQRMAWPLARLVAPGGRVVLSGLLTAQAPAALAIYRAQGLVLERRILLEGWATLVLRK